MSAPLRVATVITRLEGGAGMLALRGARAMDSGAFQQTIITGSGNGLVRAAAEAGLEVLLEPALRAPISPRSDVVALFRLYSLFRERRFDVVHTHCAKAGAVGRLAAHRAGIARVVHTFHGFPFHEFQSAARRRCYVSIERRLGRITDVALCVGSGVAVEAIRRGLVAPERIRTIGVTVDGAGGVSGLSGVSGLDGVNGRDGAGAFATSTSTPTPQARQRARRALGLPADATVVGAVGRLTYQKAPEHFLAALQALRRRNVVGVWIGSGELSGRVRRLASAMPAVRVVLAGERSDVLDLLPAFDVFALPSRYEGLPTAVVEAMVCGIPVVATAVNAVADVVMPGETGLLVPPDRPDLLADAIRHLLDSPETATRLAAAARSHIGARYSVAALRDALAAAYASPEPVDRSAPSRLPSATSVR